MSVAKTACVPAVRLVATVALTGCFAASAVASPVRITHGNESGQGHVFVLGASSCYAFTAGHVLRAGPSVPVLMVDADGYRAEGKVLAVDAQLDVGLIEVRGEATRNAKFCGSVITPMIRVEAALEQMRGKPLGAWLDRISSPAGGLDRFELSLRRGGGRQDHLVELVPGDAKHESRRDRSPQKGDSGATVWISERPAASRYSKDGEPLPKAAGRMLGVLSSVEGDVARVVRSDRLHEFIFNTLQPVNWRGIRVEPSSAIVVAYQRSAFRQPSYVDLPLHPTMLDHIAFEIDLGDQDTLVEAVSVGLAAAAAGRVPARQRPHVVLVYSSQFRPKDSAKWVREACAPTPSQRRRPGDRAPDSATCTLKAARVARGLRVEIVGDPTLVRGLKVRAGR
jgi:hypothetical protein